MHTNHLQTCILEALLFREFATARQIGDTIGADMFLVLKVLGFLERDGWVTRMVTGPWPCGQMYADYENYRLANFHYTF